TAAQPFQLDLCDELGLMVWEEHPASWMLEDSPQMAARYDRSLRETIRRATDHPAVRGVKIHHLQVYRETPLAALFEREPFALPGEEEYIALLGDIIRVLPPRIVVMRLFTDAPDDRLLAPRWRSGTQELLRKLEEHCEKHTIFQGNDGAMA
ncbi:MAG TPA: hypothetical protein P5077_08975, partial [bacterium]|nr:hypothetical protein [bacterium]